MDSESWGFVESIIIDLVILIMIIGIFKVLKKYRGNPDIEQKYNLYLNAYSLSSKEVVKKVYSTNLEEIKEICGEEAINYLYLSKILAIFITIVCSYSVLILIPIYSVGNQDPENMRNIGFYNIIDDFGLLAAPQMIFIVNVLLSYYVLKLYVQETMKSHSHSTQNKFAVRVTNLTKEITCDRLLAKLYQCLEEKCNVYVVPALSKAMIYQKELENSKSELMHYLDYEKEYEERETIKTKLFSRQKRDAIEYWEEKVEVLEKKIQSQREKARNRNSGVCIISLQRLANISELQEMLVGAFPNCKVTSIVLPDDLKWENIENEENSQVKHACYTMIFFCVFVLVLSPTAFLGYIGDIVISVGLPDGLIGFLSLYAPEIILLIYQLVLVPAAVTYLVRLEEHTSKSHEILSAISKYLLFLMFTMLFVPALGMQAIDMIITLLGSTSFNKVSEDVVERVNDTSIWFMVFILTQAFIVNGNDLLQIGRLLEVRYKAFRAISEREKYNAYLPENMNYAIGYSTLLTCFTAIFVYSIAYPLMLLFGSIYLWIRVFFI